MRFLRTATSWPIYTHREASDSIKVLAFFGHDEQDSSDVFGLRYGRGMNDHFGEQKKIPFSWNFAAGAIAGITRILGVLTMTPLDVVVGTTATGGKIVKNEGFGRLYRGISVPILMEASKRYWQLKVASNDDWGKFYKGVFGMPTMTQSLSVLTVKIRLQDKASAGEYNGSIDVVKKIGAAEGPLAMYNGLEPTMWRHMLWNAGYFGVIHQVRSLLPKRETNHGQMLNDLIAGSIGGTFGTMLNTPGRGKLKYTWTWPSIALVAKEEGVGAIYKGFVPKVLRLGPGVV
ncbi:mitochondrial carrier [Terfezia boudieri ATCC MYA-4762]|uniref:Mitochondrial carrier n=1 Tax=Terfezia boudieri ATCC MYA-4762 TaxID=1051890 RepID=A0A3N4LZU5_9PEZI|nr:mitochondrial carrier [Terfezia boudieri ATCC MYA-4762]